MTRKLTLSVEGNIIDLAKEYAAQHGLSLSELIENYLKVVVAKPGSGKKNLSPKVKKLLGSVRKTSGRSYKDVLGEELSRKYKL